MTVLLDEIVDEVFEVAGAAGRAAAAAEGTGGSGVAGGVTEAGAAVVLRPLLLRFHDRFFCTSAAAGRAGGAVERRFHCGAAALT